MYNQKPLLGTLPNYAHPLTPTVAWLFNEGSGNKVFDLSGKGNHGTFGVGAAAPTWVVGRTGPALDFDGDDYVNVGTMGNLGSDMGSHACTYIGWIKSSVTDTIMCFFGTINDGSNTLLQIILNSNAANILNAGYIKVQLRDEDLNELSGSVDSNTDITDGNPHHLCVIINAIGNEIKVFVDGCEKTVVYTTQTTPDNTANFQYPLVMGGRNNRGTINYFFSGIVDEFEIYNRRLRADNIKQLYADSYCWLAQPMEAELMYAVPPVGLSIPVAMHHYEALRAC